jgi:hypothetical protein
MRTAVLCGLIALFMFALSGCVPLGSGSGTASNLGADGPAVTETTEAATASTLPARITAGVEWLWASYTALKATVDPAAESMKKLYVAAQEALVAARAGDWLKALALYGAARELVTEIAKGGE